MDIRRHVIGKFAFKALRNLLINTVHKRVHPQTLRDSKVAISKIEDERFDTDPKKTDIEKFPDAKMCDILKRMHSLTVGDLRNKVVHHRSYRPQLAEVRKCCQEVSEVLEEVRCLLNVRDFDEYPPCRHWRKLSFVGFLS